ncbi:MAG: hypothetical protein FJ276_24465, partial [Planctomycetes bacterium]|nr:hypothetical protein [Planctomycetota bacterium]
MGQRSAGQARSSPRYASPGQLHSSTPGGFPMDSRAFTATKAAHRGRRRNRRQRRGLGRAAAFRSLHVQYLEPRLVLSGLSSQIDLHDFLIGDMAAGGSVQEPALRYLIADSSPEPPMDLSDRILLEGELDLPEGVVLLGDVPTSRWTYGCSATTAGMLFGYYDRTGYSNMYTGPTNGGLAPLVDLGQGDDPAAPIAGATSIIATQNGFDGRTTPGHVDDYWIEYGDPGPDPWEVTGVEHAWGESTADFMGTNQWKWDRDPHGFPDGEIDVNTDGSTWFAYRSDGRRFHDPVPDPAIGLPSTEGAHGMRLFAQSRGYNVTANYNQLSDNEHPDGFRFSDYKREIDQGFPVVIHVTGHTMLGVGYNDQDNTIYLHDTWGNYVSWMEWGGSYAGLQMRAVTVFHLDPAQGGLSIDWGDAPEQNTSFPTTRANSGARHLVVDGVHLGKSIEIDSDGQPNLAADGDDREGLPDDEDGVTFLTDLIPGALATIEVEASCTGRLSAWIDFDGDNGWSDPGEQIFVDRLLDAGFTTLDFAVPLSAATIDGQYTYARFRFNTAGGLAINGPSLDGEVEDYRVLIGLPQIRGTKWQDTNGNAARDPGEPTLAGWTVYCDLDGDGQRDVGEPFGTTDAWGEYAIRNLAPGDYLVREEPQDGWLQTFPGGGDAALELVTVPALEGGREGGASAALPFDIAFYDDIDQIHYQQIYAASEFRFQEAGSVRFRQFGYIDEIRFRRDESAPPFSTSNIDIQINLGYARRDPDNPAEHFASNVTDGHVAGEAYVTVFDGLLDLSSGDRGGPPHLFDIVIDVADLFYYDPYRGDLLLDLTIRNDVNTVPFDAAFGWEVLNPVDRHTLGRIWSDDITSESGWIGGIDRDGQPGGLITQFAFNPQTYTVRVERGVIAEDYDFG